MGIRTVLAAAVVLGCVAAAGAQSSVELEFHDGQVTLVARNAPLRSVLAEWARVGGATIVNAERVAGPPVTLELTAVSERQALDVLLRSVAGYMLAPRRLGTDGASAFDRILILPTSAAPRNPPPAPVTAQRPVIQRPPVILRQPGDMPADVLEGMPEGFPTFDDLGPEAGADMPITVPRPGPAMPRIGVPPQPFGGAEPQIIMFDGSEQPDPAGDPGGAGISPTPGNPFGVPFGSSTMPGVVTPAPQTQPSDDVQ